MFSGIQIFYFAFVAACGTCRGKAPPSADADRSPLKSPTGAFIAPLRYANANLFQESCCVGQPPALWLFLNKPKNTSKDASIGMKDSHCGEHCWQEGKYMKNLQIGKSGIEVPFLGMGTWEIGRASCRERV